MKKFLQVSLILVGALCISAANEMEARNWHWRLPRSLTPPPVPADNPMNAAKVELGRRLFYDADLSIDGTMSCATCHEQRRGFTDGNTTHGGVSGEPGHRNVMALANVAYLSPLTFSDPRARTLEEQSAIPLYGRHPVEMGMGDHADLLPKRLGASACYRRLFAKAFPENAGKIDTASVAKALAAFERTLLSFRSPYDRYREGDRNALSPSARQGMLIFFGSSGCSACHNGPAFNDGHYHHEEVGERGDEGMAEVTGNPEDKGFFRTAGLRNVALSAPYMHGGRAPTLIAAIDWHNSAGLTSSPVDPGEKADVVAFLQSLTDQSFVTDKHLSLPPPCAA